ncbi:F-type H+-transporting ATPase subunit delta [Filimonas zeae]|uniref:ATP synthase subunit delta n=1 Tax=Filimonas zeae TaxID=1737353 RepID=A0A917J4N9_9BACT|nr:ATP synthase F1 subunit delta [Filimonas zeae]MDR6341151.1 F-type H+-transporting ATPase subunit delta [Filimonas zeae]GGH77024.1 ATP synthase subunit delta [Filimonas zeae]
MPNPRLAGRYAKSLVDLATEKGQLEVVYKDMQYLQAVCNSSREFVNLLRSPIIKADKKDAIISAVTKSNVSELTAAFSRLLVAKGRESELPEIAAAFIDQYNAINNIGRVKLTTAVPVSEELKNAIAARVKADQGLKNVDLETAVDESLIGGFTLEFNNRLVDASVLRDLNDIKKQFSVNLFESRLK